MSNFNPSFSKIGDILVYNKSISQERFTLNWNGGITSTEPNKKDEASFFAANLSQGKEISKHGGKHGKVVSSTGRTG